MHYNFFGFSYEFFFNSGDLVEQPTWLAMFALNLEPTLNLEIFKIFYPAVSEKCVGMMNFGIFS